jgi:hypothetical protein
MTDDQPLNVIAEAFALRCSVVHDHEKADVLLLSFNAKA